MGKSKYYVGIKKRKREDEHGREILDPRPMRNAVQDQKTFQQMKDEYFINRRVLEDDQVPEDIYVEDSDGEEFDMPGLSRYEEAAVVFDEAAAKVRKARAQDIANEQKAKRERYEAAQRAAAMKKYGLVEPPASEPKPDPDDQ